MRDLDTETLAKDIESGEYFAVSRRWYAEIYHTPIAQRSYYIIVILLAMINVYFAILSFSRMFPITIEVPFVTYSNDLWNDIPRIHRIATDDTEEKNVAVMKYIIASYVDNRESYDLPGFELRYRNIWSQSTGSVFEEYKRQIDASNAYSFYRIYTNHARRVIDIISLDYDRGKDVSQAHVVFEASVIGIGSGKEESHSRWHADFTYKYTDFAVDQSLDTDNPVARFFGLTGGSLKASGEKRKVVPMTFIVSDYKVKELLE